MEISTEIRDKPKKIFSIKACRTILKFTYNNTELQLQLIFSPLYAYFLSI